MQLGDPSAPVPETEAVLETAPTEETAAEAPATAEPDQAALLAKADARIKELEQQQARLQQQNASYQGNLRQRQRVEDEQADIRRQLQGINQYLDALVGLQGQTDAEEVGRQVAALRQRRVQDQAMDETERRSTAAYQDIIAYADRVGLSVDTAPEFATVRAAWSRGISPQGQVTNITQLETARRLAEQVAWEHRAARDSRPAPPVQAEVQRARPPSLSPTATGRPGAVQITDDTADALWIEGKITDAQYRDFLSRTR